MLFTFLIFACSLQSPQATQGDTAVLRIGNRLVVVFRGRLGAATPQERAAAAARRVETALVGGRDTVSSETRPEGILVLMGAQPVFTVTPADADTAAGASTTTVAGRATAQLRLAVSESREARNLRSLLTALALALAATAAVILALRLLVLGRRRVCAKLDLLTVAAAPKITIRGLALIHPRQLVVAARVLVTVAAWGLGLVAVYLYATFVLSQFPWTRPWGEALGQFLLSTLGQLGLGALHAVPSLFTVVLIFVVARFLADLVRTIFDAVEQRRLVIPGIHPDTAHPTRRIVIALLWLFALVVAYPYLPGSGSAAFKSVSVFTGVLITLGSAGLVGQAMSGLVLMYSRSFKVGDFVQVAGVQGTVVELGLLSTRLRTPKNEFVTLPNNVVVSGPLTDYTAAGEHHRPLLIYSSVTIGYDVPWRQVHDLLTTAAQKTDGVLKEPAPFVLQRALDDSYVEYQVNASIDSSRAAELPSIYSQLHASIQDAFWAVGVEIMSPSYHAVRDGNTVTIPAEHRPKQRTAAFRVDVNPSDSGERGATSQSR